jgi:hypothetical protein
MPRQKQEDLSKDNAQKSKTKNKIQIPNEAIENILNHFKENIHRKNNIYDQIDFWIQQYKVQTQEDLIIFQIIKSIEKKELNFFISNLISLEPGVLDALKRGIYIKTNDIFSFLINLHDIIMYIDNEKENDISIRLTKTFLEEKLKFWENVMSEL